MDPVSVVGIIGSTLGVTGVILKSLKGLANLRHTFQSADVSVHVVESQLNAIKATLDVLREWMMSLEDPSDYGPLLGEIEMVIRCCEIIMLQLYESIHRLQRNAKQNLSMRGKLGYLLGETFIKQMRNDLADIAGSLHLLISTSQLKTTEERRTKLRADESQSLLRQVQDNASSYGRSARQTSEMTSNRSTRGGTTQDSHLLDDDFSFDSDLLSSAVYRTTLRKLMRQQKSNIPDPPRRRSNDNAQALNSITEGFMSDQTGPFGDENAIDASSSQPSTDEPSENMVSTSAVSPAQRPPSFETIRSQSQPANGESPLTTQKTNFRGISTFFRRPSPITVSEQVEVYVENLPEIALPKSSKAVPTIKIMLLGSGDSGKSTLLKDMEYNFCTETPSDLREWRGAIWDNTVASMRDVLNALDSKSMSLDGPRSQHAAKLVRSGQAEFGNTMSTKLIRQAIITLREDSGIQNCMRMANLFQFDAAASFWFLNAERTLTSDYVPTHADVLRIRRRTTGIHRTQIQIGSLNVQIFDTGGERAERRKWDHCYKGTNVVVFVADLSCYDEALYENSAVNRMEDSLTLFGEVAKRSVCTNAHLILLFTKEDRLRDKLPRSPLRAYFKDIQGQTFEDVVSYFQWRFTSLVQKASIAWAERRPQAPRVTKFRVLHSSFFEGPNPAFMVANTLVQLPFHETPSVENMTEAFAPRDNIRSITDAQTSWSSSEKQRHDDSPRRKLVRRTSNERSGLPVRPNRA